MKTLNKTAVDRRFEKTLIKPVIRLYKGTALRPQGSLLVYNRMLNVVIPGKPIADGRVRFGQDSIYNPNKANMMKIFDRIYKGSEAEKLTIFGHVRFDITVYLPLPKTYKKIIGPDNFKLVESGNFHAPTKPDNDNFEKICYDLLQDRHYLILFADECIIDNRTTKFYVPSEQLARIEMRVYFNDPAEIWMMDKLKTNKDYLGYLISPKYMNRHIKPSKWKSYFYKTINEWVKNNKNNKSVPTTVKNILRVYNTEELRLIGEGRNIDAVKFNIIKDVERICKL